MTLSEKILALRKCSLFDGIGDGEVSVIAEACVSRKFTPGVVVARANEVPQRLLIVLQGKLTRGDGVPVPTVFDVPGLLLNLSPKLDVSADAHEGAECLVVSKSHFFTVIQECPSVLVNVLTEVEEEPRDNGATL